MPLTEKIMFASSPSHLIIKGLLLQQNRLLLLQLYCPACTIPKIYEKVLAELSGLPIMREIVNILVAAVVCRFMQNRHAGRSLGSKRVTILVGNSSARAIISML
jgi:hypothetical protein